MSPKWLLLGLAACGRVGFDDARGDAGTAIDGRIHEYKLNNSYADTFGGPALVPMGGTFTAGGYQFGANQGLTLTDALPPAVYTIDLVFSFDDVASWQKVIDYANRTDHDSGVYVYESALQVVISSGTDFLTGQKTISPSVPLRMTLTRSASKHVAGYIGRALVPAERGGTADPPAAATSTFEYDDTDDVLAVFGTTVEFFIDDATTADEAAPGTVRRITIYDVALTAAQIASLP